MRNLIRKADIILFAVLLAAGLMLSALTLRSGGEGGSVVVTVAGETYGRYSLSEDREITVERDGHLNKITIKDGAVQMSEANCRNQLCVRQGTISKANETIVCLPNRIVVRIEGKGGEYDVISG